MASYAGLTLIRISREDAMLSTYGTLITYRGASHSVYKIILSYYFTMEEFVDLLVVA